MTLQAHDTHSSEFNLQERQSPSMQPQTSQGNSVTRSIRYAKPDRAAQACRKCRRLKMRCVVSVGSSTCNRCRRLGQTCEFRQDSQSRPLSPSCRRDRVFASPNPYDANAVHAKRASQAYTVQASRTSAFTERSADVVSPRVLPHNQGSYNFENQVSRQTEQTITESGDLLSIYSTSPVTAVVDNNASYHLISAADQRVAEEPDLGSHQSDLIEEGNHRSLTDSENPLSQSEVKQLIHIFIERILHFIPVFRKEDFDPQTLYEENRHLAYCICYVTSFFLPGGMSIANALCKYISDFVLEKCTSVAGIQNSNLQDLQAMMILYAYSRPPRSGPAIHHTIPAALLKTLAEGHAINIGLHRSVESVKAALKSKVTAITAMLDFKKYIYWLWLYTVAHHTAILNGTPPSIRSDASIRNASRLLADVHKSPRISRILGEVELCLLWEKASTPDCRLSEWWCVPDSLESLDFSPSAALEVAESEIQAWCSRWNHFIAQGGYGYGLDFHFRYARFCISSYALRFIQGHPGILTRSESASVKQCMQYALDILDWTARLSPMGKDALRYMSDFGFVMITFAALFITQVCQHVKSLYAESESALYRVTALSELMMDLAVSSSHFTAQLGRSLQRRVAQISEQKRGEAQNAAMQDSPPGGNAATVFQIRNTMVEPFTNLDQVDESVCLGGFLNESALWDPTVWLSDFLNDAGEWSFS